MRSATVFASVLAFAVSALAQDATPGFATISAPEDGATIPSGETFTIVWDPAGAAGAATISLIGGEDPSTLQNLGTIATGIEIDAGSYKWAIDCSFGTHKTYGIKIADESDDGATFQYSFPFHIEGPSCDNSDSTSSSSAPTSTVTAPAYPTVTLSSTKSPAPTNSSTTSKPTVTGTATLSTTTLITFTSTYSSAPTDITTITTTATSTSSSSGSSSVPSATESTAPPVSTAGAARAGAALGLGLLAAVFAL